MQRLKRYIALLLMCVISVIVVPKELIHCCVDHNDTEDVKSVPNAPLSIEHQHTHCEFLKLNVPLYLSDFKFFQIELPVSYSSFVTLAVQKIVGFNFQLPALRGPPFLV